ncbi:hypothetical protein ALC62_11456 [Cyphomyrmex costatus]|uniref:MADF domain-containing protein n=1 Tax=Cyphomyrmex costatus TaxID=456900 RepID=A0A151ICP3_9HYME|nr:hypothetical protein ALC62_11456 [Cyphomyrmex costatus]
MPPKKQIFTIDQEFLLIDAVKNRPQLWDVSHPTYRRNDIKEVLWQEVADLVGIPNITGK